MTTSESAHPPRPGEGTGPLPPLTTAAQPAHTTGPLPPLPESTPESPFRRALREQLAAIDSGHASLREGLGEILTPLLTVFSGGAGVVAGFGGTVLNEVPDAVIRFWLGKVAAEQVTLEACLGTLASEGLTSNFRKAIDVAAGLVQKGAPGTEGFSAMKALNMAGAFELKATEFSRLMTSAIASKATEELKSGLDAQTANHLMAVLRKHKD